MIVSSEVSRIETCMSGPTKMHGRALQRTSFRFSDIWRAPLNDFPIRDEILYQYLPISLDMDILEIGPGSGFTSFRLARQVRSVTLVDVAAESLAKAQKELRYQANVRCVCADPTRPDFVERLKFEFDVAFALDVFEYLVDPEMCLRNLGHALRPHGEIFLSYPNVKPPVGDGVTYFSRVSDLENLLQQAGYSHWQIFSVRQEPYARLVHRVAHEYPLQLYRRMRRHNHMVRPQTYESSWVFTNLTRLEPYKIPMHLYWWFLNQLIKLGGQVFTHASATEDILGKQIVIRARK